MDIENVRVQGFITGIDLDCTVCGQVFVDSINYVTLDRLVAEAEGHIHHQEASTSDGS